MLSSLGLGFLVSNSVFLNKCFNLSRSQIPYLLNSYIKDRCAIELQALGSQAARIKSVSSVPMIRSLNNIMTVMAMLWWQCFPAVPAETCSIATEQFQDVVWSPPSSGFKISIVTTSWSEVPCDSSQNITVKYLYWRTNRTDLTFSEVDQFYSSSYCFHESKECYCIRKEDLCDEYVQTLKKNNLV